MDSFFFSARILISIGPCSEVAVQSRSVQPEWLLSYRREQEILGSVVCQTLGNPAFGFPLFTSWILSPFVWVTFQHSCGLPQWHAVHLAWSTIAILPSQCLMWLKKLMYAKEGSQQCWVALWHNMSSSLKIMHWLVSRVLKQVEANFDPLW